MARQPAPSGHCGAEISGLDLTALASRDGLKITADQQYALLSALGIAVSVE